jgi:hypothetical protein
MKTNQSLATGPTRFRSLESATEPAWRGGLPIQPDGLNLAAAENIPAASKVRE